MEGISVDGRNGKLIQSVAEMIVRFLGDVFPKLAEWEQRLKADPQILDTLEREVQQEFSRGAGLVVAGLIAVVMQTKKEPWGHWAGLKICCDFAQIVCVSGFDHIGFGAE